MNTYTFDNIATIRRLGESAPVELERLAMTVRAGFESPASDYLEERLDITRKLVRNPNTTFYVEVVGDSMKDVGIYPGDTVIVDKSLEARNHDVIVAVVDGCLTIKILELRDGQTWLLPANPAVEPLLITKYMNFEVWGVVTYGVYSARTRIRNLW
jgi:DNA polymerase V